MSGQDVLAALDAELFVLPESLRGPLVLCYLQGATRDEAAEQLKAERRVTGTVTDADTANRSLPSSSSRSTCSARTA